MDEDLHLLKIAQKYQLPNADLVREVKKMRSFARRHNKVINVIENGNENEYVVTRVNICPIHTQFGHFFLYSLKLNDRWSDYNIIVKAKKLDEETCMPVFDNKEYLLVRIDSGCVTGQVYDDNTCDCKEQLHKAMKLINTEGEGMIIHIPSQDGRGKGLSSKMSTLNMQSSMKMNTVAAAETVFMNDKPNASGEELTNIIDERTYTGAIAILKFFGIEPPTKINIATNNSKKEKAFKENGYEIVHVDIIVEATEQTIEHLKSKQQFLGHDLKFPDVNISTK